MKKKKKVNWFLKILCGFFIMFVCLYISRETGYYQKTVREKAVMTDAQIKIFENDIASGAPVDVTSYIPKKEDYSNVFTKSANEISNRLGKILNKQATSVWDFLKTLFIG